MPAHVLRKDLCRDVLRNVQRDVGGPGHGWEPRGLWLGWSSVQTTDPGPKPVVQVLAHDTIGGTELMVVMLASGLRDRGFNSEVALVCGEGPVAERLRETGVTVHQLARRGPWLLGALRLIPFFARSRYDIVNVYGIKASLAVRIVCRLFSRRTAVVCGVQGLHVTETEDPESIKGRMAITLERLSSGLVDAYEVNSHGAIAWL